jgi:hypothetical protein
MAELDDAEAANLRAAFERIFSKFPMVPSDEIEAIRSYGLAEDGRTLIVTLDTVNGATLMIQATPGRPISVGMV